MHDLFLHFGRKICLKIKPEPNLLVGSAIIEVKRGKDGFTTSITFRNPADGHTYHFTNLDKSIIQSLTGAIKKCLALVESEPEPYI